MSRPFNAGDYFTPEDQYHFDRNYGNEFYTANGQALGAFDVQDEWGMRTVLDEVYFLDTYVDTRHLPDKLEAFEDLMREKEMIERGEEGVVVYGDRPRTDEQFRYDTKRFLEKLATEARYEQEMKRRR